MVNVKVNCVRCPIANCHYSNSSSIIKNANCPLLKGFYYFREPFPPR